MSCELAALGRLHREHVLNPITALAFYTSTDGQKYLLAGEDTDIKVYHVQTSRFSGQLPVFKAQSIHGIAVPPAEISEKSSLILVWGGNSVKVLPRDVIESLISGHGTERDLTRGATEARAPDWIFDGRVSPFGDRRIVLLTAHNEVIPAHVDPSRGKLIFDKILSPSRPILYSGNFFWVSKECVLVAAGTVFGEILVWKCHLGASEQNQDCEVLFVFTGHEGSIFGVHISPEIRTSTGENLRLLASCSDDRTIRIWDITERQESQDLKQKGYDTHISDARETGFGNNVEVSAHGDPSARCLATVMGHASRIWQVEFPQNQLLSRTSNIVGLYSFGEDATAQKWNLSLNLPLSELGTSSSPIKSVAKLTHQETFSNHTGKHIWSHATTSEDDYILVATGGSDGKIALIGTGIKSNSSNLTEGNQTLLDKKKAVAWSLTDVLRSSRAIGAIIEESNVISDDIPLAPQSTKPKNAKEAFNRYTFISDKRLLAATNSGRIFAGSFEDDLTWIELALPDEIGQIVFSHALHGTSPVHPLAFIGTSNGYIFYYSESGDRSLQSLVKVDGKVADIFWLSDASASNNSQFQIFVTLLRSTNAVIIHVDPDTLTTKQISVTLESGFMVTAAAFIQGYLILGSRKGIIAVFSPGEDGNYSVILTVEVHRDEAITSLLPLRSRDDRPRNYILSTCRDGRYRIHEIPTKAHQSAAVLIHEALPPFVSSVEGAWFTNNSDGTRDLMLCGFRSSNFVVWNETRRHEVATVDCGGSSRSYAWAPIRSQPDGFRFVFTKAGQMHVFSQTHAPHRTLKPGGHGREIKAVSASSGRYVATAAEDTVIRIWEYGSGEGEAEGEHSGLRCVAALERHATGIQALKWFGNEYLFSSGGNEEFFVWRLNKLESDDFTGLAVVCEAVFPDRSEIGDARITDFDVTCVSSDEDGAYEFSVSMALSNSTLQTYAYTKKAGFRLLRRWTYTGACLTQVRHLGSNHILTAATDGYLAVYANTSQAIEADTDGSPLPIVTKLHQNTIKALDIRQVSSENDTSLKFLLVTGGDDNALGVTYISVSPNSTSTSPTKANMADVKIQSKSIIRSAHAAGITGAAIARLNEDSAIVVTGSNDQRVKAWRLIGWDQDQKEKEKEKGRVRAQLLEDRYSAVADAGGLEVFDDGRKALVVGVGFEVWDLGV
ncbi:WD40 repeat-like protein [Annulohypoxylon maeteangense]|uniref:WD40 repeat-like protein n=1 Tax=Annulohypoxylon maeteangense TaxID=1927788 RepID=UPI002008D9BC|nr:WD40 repeat-like protein [Annulohypoxylon maeteangense]KAI0882173.1 WD40 repeat-like protein [Annulohypoxylon maeteangense]